VLQRHVPPPGYFYQAQHRIGSASFSMTVSQLVTLIRHPKLANFITASEELFNQDGDGQSLQSSTQEVVNAAAELQTPFHHDINSTRGEETNCAVAGTYFPMKGKFILNACGLSLLHTDRTCSRTCGPLIRSTK
jgi:hypothetical protein